MKKIDFAQTISIIANIGLVGGILLLAYELRQNSVYLQEQAPFQVFQNRLSANVVRVEDPEIERQGF